MIVEHKQLQESNALKSVGPALLKSRVQEESAEEDDDDDFYDEAMMRGLKKEGCNSTDGINTQDPQEE